MMGIFYLAWRYLVYHRIKASILVASIALIVYLPIGLNVLVGESAAQLTARAESTPLLIGARGSPLELVLNSLYFDTDPPAPTTYAEMARIAETGWAVPIPLHVRFRAQGQPIVGTSLDYFTLRGLSIAEGRPLALLGECVLGASVARRMDSGPGDSVTSSPESAFDLAGVYPLRMRVAGVLAPSHGPDDEAIFVDVKTAWVIEGLVHGHQDLASPEAAGAVLNRSGDRITANASLVEYNEITPDNLESFHFHGDLGGYPLTALVAWPRSAKGRVLLMGEYQAADDPSQVARPEQVMNELLETIFTIRSYVVAAVGLVGAATLATAALVFTLSMRLRRREIETLIKIGCPSTRVATLLTSEVIAILCLGGAFAGLLTLLTARFGSEAIRAFMVS